MNKESGLSLYLSIIIMSIILSIVFGISSILLVQLSTIKGMENSVIAFYAADTGIEHVLVDRINPIVFDACTTEATACSLGDARYYVKVLTQSQADCNAATFCIKSVGIYKDSRRAIEVTY